MDFYFSFPFFFVIGGKWQGTLPTIVFFFFFLVELESETIINEQGRPPLEMRKTRSTAAAAAHSHLALNLFHSANEE